MSISCETCGRAESKDVKLTETLKLIICIDCATNHFLKSRPDLTPKPTTFKQLVGYNTKDIYQHLSKAVIGQDKAKKVLSIGLLNHMKRLVSEEEIEKNNILLIGSTGTGKTMLVKELSERTQIPYGTADATTLTQTGWVGDDPESVLLDLYRNCNGDKEKVEKGIVFIDEIDKIRKDVDSRNESSNAQRGLLKILEGAVVTLIISGKGTSYEKSVLINTKNILFICAGSFNGLADIVKQRVDKKGIGFNAEVEDIKVDLTSNEVTTEDLENYGFYSEFLGRLSMKVSLDDLDASQLRLILTKAKNSLVRQYTKLFDMDGIKLEFSSTGLEEISKQAMKLKTGARGLKTILEKVLFDFQYDYTDKELYITREVVLEQLGGKDAINHSKKESQDNVCDRNRSLG